MANKVQIRRAKSDEGVKLGNLAFRSKAVWGYPREFMQACRAELTVSSANLRDPSRDYFVAKSCDRILGYYALERRSENCFELEALFVEPEFIGQGIGGQLVEHAKNQARSGGARFIMIQGDPHAAGFYRAVGAVQVGTRESDSIPGRYLPEFLIFLEADDLPP